MTAVEKWSDCLKNLGKKGLPGECPFCLSKDTDFSVTENGNSRYGDLWCNSCKHALHISRMEFTDLQFEHKEIPTGLIY